MNNTIVTICTERGIPIYWDVDRHEYLVLSKYFKNLEAAKGWLYKFHFGYE